MTGFEITVLSGMTGFKITAFAVSGTGKGVFG
jgi:rdgB/HAM1 family non-canonical purine NTP pyrophosphatase